jgi:hypothetical protein
MAQPCGNYPSSTRFGHRIREHVESKEGIARAVVQRFLSPGQGAFLSDGTTTFYVATAIYELFWNRWRAKKDDPKVEFPQPVRIDTNNIAIAHEFLFWFPPQHEGGGPLVKVSLANGNFDHDLYATLGGRTLTFVRDALDQRLTTVILSVSAMYGKYGPLGRGSESLEVKQNAIAANVRTVWLVEHEKLSIPWDDDGPDWTAGKKLPPVYTIPQEWQRAMERESTYVVASRHPKLRGSDDTPPRTAPRTSFEWYLCNRMHLQQTLKDRFYEVEPIPAKARAE